ncbi:hypothetical protein ACJIZ3_025027 [Penstemon smallii]|uniref:Transcription factor MYC/MYB N-terminal domain-containing protein n=1 Tax=Penstemon smallii TaxID=265156 RepID=A0ABD3TV68_9LAMI
MESGLPMLNCLLQHTLRSLCTSSDSCFPSKWAYAVFWKILPRNYPPPKWDDGTGLFDRAKGNIRNWILVWEDGFCDFCECERAGSGYVKGRFGADIFFKMSHEVYNFGEGLIGKVASDNSHKWIFRDSPTENDPTFISSWNVSIDPPRAWEAQFNSGIETIAIISVREGAIQLGSFNKVVEDLNLVISIQRKFSYLNSLPGIYAIQRPFLQIQNSNNFFHSNNSRLLTENNEIGTKRQNYEQLDILPTKSIYLGHNSPQNGISTGALPLCPIPPLLSKIPQSYYASEAFDHENTLLNNHGSNSKSVFFQEIPLADYNKVEATYAQDEAARLEDREHGSNLH